ncbi:unnamed protein product, partial [Prorocentrum cordatum]
AWPFHVLAVPLFGAVALEYDFQFMWCILRQWFPLAVAIDILPVCADQVVHSFLQFPPDGTLGTVS